MKTEGQPGAHEDKETVFFHFNFDDASNLWKMVAPIVTGLNMPSHDLEQGDKGRSGQECVLASQFLAPDAALQWTNHFLTSSFHNAHNCLLWHL